VDQASLVRERITGGEKLLSRLRERWLDLVASLWAKTADDGQWYLYLVSPRVDTDGRSAVYGIVLDTLTTMEAEWSDPFERIGPLDVKVLRPGQPLAQGALELHRRFPDAIPTWHGNSVLGSVSVEGAYIYPAKMFTAPAAPSA
jgi:hypothetical protein